MTLARRPRARPRVALLALLTLLAAMTTGCSWLVGVSDDPVVVAGSGGNDAGDADAPHE